MRARIAGLLGLTAIAAACGVAEIEVDLPWPPAPTQSPPPPTTTPTPVPTPVPTSTVIEGTVVYDGCIPVLGTDPDDRLIVPGPITLTTGDAVFVHQTQDRLGPGESAGRYALATIAHVTSAGGTEAFVGFPSALDHEFSSDSARRAQICAMPHFDELLVADGATFEAAPWDGNSGGILPLRANRIVIHSSAALRANFAGFRGGAFGEGGTAGGNGEGLQAEASPSPTPTPNVGGGGGSSGGGGGGGGGAGAGGAGGGSGGGANGAARAVAAGFAPFGGGGGGVLYVEAIALVGSGAGFVEANGQEGMNFVADGVTSEGGGGGGGAGGTIVLRGLVAGTGLTCSFVDPFSFLVNGGNGGGANATTAAGGGGGGGGAILGGCESLEVGSLEPLYGVTGGAGGVGGLFGGGADGDTGSAPP